MAESVATLYVEVDADDAKRAVKALAQLEKQSKKTEQQTKKQGQATAALKGQVSNLKDAFLGLAAAYGGRELLRTADAFTQIENKLKNVTDSTEELARVEQELFDISQRSRVGYASTSTLYQRLAVSTEALGVSESNLLAITEGLQKAFIVSGATAQEASNAVIQLSQGLASGQLRGEEFRSVSEQGIRIIRALSDELGLTVGELRELAYAGELTTEVFTEAFLNQIPKIQKEFKEFDITVNQAIEKLNNSLIAFLGTADEVGPSTRGIAAAISDISEAIDQLNDVDPVVINSITALAASIAAASLGGKAVGVVTGILVAAGLNAATFNQESARYTENLAGNVEFLRGQADQTAAQIEKIQSQLDDLKGSDVAAFSPGLTRRLDALKAEYASYIEDIQAIQKKQFATIDQNLTSYVDQTNKKIKKLSLFEQLFGTDEERKAIKQTDSLLEEFFGEMDAKSKEAQKASEEEKKAQKRVREREKENTKSFKDQLAERRESLRTYQEEREKSYNEELDAATDAYSGMERAIRDYQDEANDAASATKRAFDEAFSEMEDAITEFVKTGKVEFSSFIDSILEELIRTQISQPIVSGIAGASSGIFDSIFSGIFQANGGAWQNGVQMFASGGVVNSPTLFGTQSGPAVMGEAGPEAILPLERKGGKLGVSQAAANVNVYIENAPEGTTATSTPNANGDMDIMVMIADAVNNGLNEGTYDNTLQRVFNINRRGY